MYEIRIPENNSPPKMEILRPGTLYEGRVIDEV
jgi:hypothetical protein